MSAHIVNKTALPDIAHEYIAQQHMPKIKGTMAGFKLGMVVYYLTDNVNALVEEHKGMLTEFKIMDASGNIDIDKLQEAANASLEMNNGKFEIPKMGYVVDKEDLAALFNIAKIYAE